LVFAPGSATYPKEWGEQGVQGEVTISAQIKADNVAEQVVVVKSSGNPKLDQNALAFAQRVKFRLEKRRSATEPEPVEIDFQFYTQHLETFWQKTCGQFLKDVEYFKKTFPDKSANEVLGYRAMSGLAFLSAMQKNPQLAPSGNTFAQDVEFCQQNPGQLLMPHLMEKNGVKASTKDAVN
jgi:TonB family protein